eukprot:gene10497-12864_t
MSFVSFFRSALRPLSLVVALFAALTAHAQSPSAADGFDPNVDGNVYAVALQADGRLIIAGQFTTLRPASGPAAIRNNIARLNLDGSVDLTFDPNTGSTDFYLLHPLRQANAAAGVIVVRFNLAPLEATWIDLGLRSQGERILVADDQDVVIMSSVQAWKYAVLDHADPSRRQALQASARYPQAIGPDLDLPASLEVHQGQLVKLPVPDASGAKPMLAQQRQIV